MWIVCALFLGVIGSLTTGCTVESGRGSDDDDDSGDTVMCGDNTCEGEETAQSCPADCATSGPKCGDGTCGAGETAQSCAADCAPTGGMCGNNICEANEPTSCPSDCPASLRVQNNSSYTVYNLYLARCNGDWSSDQTGSSYILPGNAFTLTGIPPGCWWFQASTAGDEIYWQTPSPVTLAPALQYTWTLGN